MIILGVETSCDETAVAVIRDDKTIMANLVLSQLEEHKSFGGVVPEIAARAHMDHLDTLIAAALSDAKISFKNFILIMLIKQENGENFMNNYYKII